MRLAGLALIAVRQEKFDFHKICCVSLTNYSDGPIDMLIDDVMLVRRSK